MEFGATGSREVPDIALVAIAAPVMRLAFGPAVPDGLVGVVVIGAAQDELVLAPDQRVGPVPPGCPHGGVECGPLLTGHEQVDGARGEGDDVRRGLGQEFLPGVVVEVVVGDGALGTVAGAAVVAVVHPVGQIRQRQVGRLALQQGRDHGLIVRVATDQAVLAQYVEITSVGAGAPFERRLRGRRRLQRPPGGPRFSSALIRVISSLTSSSWKPLISRSISESSEQVREDRGQSLFVPVARRSD